MKIRITKGLTVLLTALCLALPFAAKADRILDYETGAIFEGDAKSKDFQPTYTYTDDGKSQTMEIYYRYAIIEESPYYENCVSWYVPTSGWLRLNGKPELNCISRDVILPEGYSSATLTILEAEYKDFNYELQPSIPVSVYFPPTLFIDITPYEGFYPTQPASINPQSLQKRNDIWYHVYPVAYDYEHKTVRAYTHIKVRVDYQEEASGIGVADRILNYETATFFEDDASKKEYLPREVFNSNITGRTMEYDINYAVVEPSIYTFYEDCVTWHFPSFGFTYDEGKPELSYRCKPVKLPKGYKSVSVTILEEEYKDFNFALQPAIPFPLGHEPGMYVDVTPYEGFSPSHPVQVDCQSFRGDYTAYVYFNPIMYDYENKVIRAYKHIKFRLDYLKEEAGIEEVGADDAPAEYFNMQGIRVDKPGHGVYIERKGGKATKVVY